MIQSRITRKAQTTIPAPVRKALGPEGRRFRRPPNRGGVVMTRAEPADDPFATFTEWGSPEDTEGYASP
jgi:antitoxin PrlF